MSQINNPFIRGYQRPHIVRTLLITYEDDCPPIWRPLHSSQAHLRDDQVRLRGAQSLHKEQMDAGVPPSLLTVIQLAAQADVRFLVFDPNAAILEGLPVYDE